MIMQKTIRSCANVSGVKIMLDEFPDNRLSKISLVVLIGNLYDLFCDCNETGFPYITVLLRDAKMPFQGRQSRKPPWLLGLWIGVHTFDCELFRRCFQHN
jgi:hypothetical protein